MKKALTFALSALLLAGCSQDDGVMNTTGEEVKMSFSVQTGNGAQTRANYGIGENIDQLLCAVYEKTGENTYTFVKQEEGTQQTEGAADFIYEPVLLKGHTYKVVFWAMDKDAGYNVNNELTDIKFPTAISANADNMDVFTGHSVDATAGSAQPQTVKLTRPFGQLNFATTAEDLASVRELLSATDEVKLTTSVEVSAGVMTAYDAFNQNGTYSTGSITFTTAAIPTEKITVADTEYEWLSTNFLMTNQTVTCTLKLFVNEKEANSLTVNQVPVKANTRTNIYGRLMTGVIKYNVSLDKGFTTPDTDIDPDNWPLVNNTENNNNQ